MTDAAGLYMHERWQARLIYDLAFGLKLDDVLALTHWEQVWGCKKVCGDVRTNAGDTATDQEKTKNDKSEGEACGVPEHRQRLEGARPVPVLGS